MNKSVKTSWLPLFITNFLGVLNDNYLKYLVFFISTTWMMKDQESIVIMLASALFVLPYIAFSPIAGKLARDHSKAKIIQRAKLYEIPIMAIASVGFILQSVTITMFAIFLMGLQSCLFSPAKYGIIRDIGGKEGIPFGTGAMEMLTFMGVLIGTYIAGVTSDISLIESLSTYRTLIVCAALIFFALLGWLFSLKIAPKETVPDDEDETTLNPILFLIRSYKWSKQIKGLNIVIIGLATFWAIGSLLQMNITVHCRNVLQLSDTATSTIMALVAVGIGAGCYMTGVISNKKLKMYLVPIGGTGMLLCVSTIFIVNPSTILFTVLIVLTAFFAGIFKIPLNSFIQDRVHGRKLGLILAYNNLMLFTFILLSAGIFGLVETMANSLMVFAAVAVITLIITIVAWLRIPGANKLKAL
ncbi:MFS transporter [Carboxylicivirga mesophila]|uniref:MFS transporter n=1 Tax=Carboxylicivirga mesophila TaxID=1166478 RepID=A0ABS5KBK0_9BACT|nr:MFS transporter [Carboxylicivirga mesophila]MBS2212361.1 MFS transporter [Carboxylicivirga mesophila]